MGLIVKPYTFVNGTVANAIEVNSDFDPLYNLVNGNIDHENIDLTDDYTWTGNHTFDGDVTFNGSVDITAGLALDQLTITQTGNDYALNITADSVTTATGGTFSFDGITTGTGILIDSNSSSTSAHLLLHVRNQNSLAVNAIPIQASQAANGSPAFYGVKSAVAGAPAWHANTLIGIDNDGDVTFEARTSASGAFRILATETSASNGYLTYFHSTDSWSFGAAGATQLSIDTNGLNLNNGSAANPTLEWGNDCGIYRVGAATLGFTANGSLRASISSSSLDMSLPISMNYNNIKFGGASDNYEIDFEDVGSGVGRMTVNINGSSMFRVGRLGPGTNSGVETFDTNTEPGQDGQITAASLAKAWAFIDGDTTPPTDANVLKGYNVPSCGHSATGTYEISFTNDMADTNYAVVATSADAGANDVSMKITSKSVSGFTLVRSREAVADDGDFSIVVFGELA